MPSSLIFAGLVVAWLLILVPMIARRRQEVVRPSDAALACRVLDRPAVGGRTQEVTEVEELDEKSRARDEPAPPEATELSGTAETAEFPLAHQPRFRPGRGGFDPEAAALAASARYAFRQRVVLALLLGAMATALIAFFGLPVVWWLHGLLDLILIGYLAQLRRQVRLEEEIRHRRASRMAGARRSPAGEPSALGEVGQAGEESPDRAEVDEPERPSAAADDADGVVEVELSTAEPDGEPVAAAEPDVPGLPPLQPTPQLQRPIGTSVVELDDEDPELDQLDVADPRYRRAVGE